MNLNPRLLRRNDDSCVETMGTATFNNPPGCCHARGSTIPGRHPRHSYRLDGPATFRFTDDTLEGSMRRLCLKTHAVAFCLIFLACCCQAQFRASLRGVVTDPQGALVRGA